MKLKYWFTSWKIMVAAIALVVASLAPSAYAETVTINFDSLVIAPGDTLTGAPLTNYLAGYGVTLSGMQSGEYAYVINLSPYPAYQIPSPPNVFSAGGSPTGYNTLTLNFATPVDNFSFDRTGTFGLYSPSGTVMGPWSAAAYNASNVSLGSVGNDWIATNGDVPIQSFTLAAQGISYINFIGDSYNVAGFALPDIDNWTFTTVPEPATMLLLGLGLIGVAGIRRKLRK